MALKSFLVSNIRRFLAKQRFLTSEKHGLKKIRRIRQISTSLPKALQLAVHRSHIHTALGDGDAVPDWGAGEF